MQLLLLFCASFFVGQTNTTLSDTLSMSLHAYVLPRPACAALTITRLYVQILYTCSWGHIHLERLNWYQLML